MQALVRQRGNSGRTDRFLTLGSVAVLFSALAACGGGGGGDTTAAATEQPAAVTPTPVAEAPAITLGNDAFYFAPDASHATAGALDSVGGGQALFAAWDPNNPKTALVPGMKVLFFGTATGCPRGTEGPLTAASETQLGSAASLAGLDASAASSGLRWTPFGNATACDASVRSLNGNSTVFVNASSASGAVGLYTTSGLQADGAAPFFGPFDAGGQNGQGTNAGIIGTFVNFRQVWSAADPVQPWTGSAQARLRSVQSVGSVQVNAADGETVQAKQQMMATFLNVGCTAELKGKPCQIQYLLNTAVVRSGVSDWSQVSWFQNGGVSFDPAQGSIPVVDGPIKANGTSTVDGATGLSLFSSQGSATLHAPFKDVRFDATISFDQLQNVLRVTTAKWLSVEVSAVTDSQIASYWGSGWNDRSKWVLLTADVAQEVYNPQNQRRVEIAGGFTSLFAGAQP